MAIKQINNTTFQTPELGDVKPVVTIGGKAPDKFIPNLNVSFHDDEFFINLNRRDKLAVSACEKAVELPGIDTDIWHIDESGRLKWDIEFNSRPSVNSWTWELKHSDGIEFIYQRELTDEEKAEGIELIGNIAGSYEIRCRKRDNKYKLGILGRIHKPFCYDSNDSSIYADLLITNGQLTIAIDDTWLDNAVYPVRLDPTIGFTGTPNSSGQTSTAAYVMTGLASGSLVASSSGTCNSLWFYNPTSQTCSFGVAVYDASYNLLASKNENKSWPVGWNKITLNSSLSIVSGNTYRPTFLLADSLRNVASDTTLGNTCYRTTATSFPDPWTDFANSRTYVPPVYLEYTESGGGSGNPYYYMMNQ